MTISYINAQSNINYVKKTIYLRGFVAAADEAPVPAPAPPAFKSRKMATARLLAILPNVANYKARKDTYHDDTSIHFTSSFTGPKTERTSLRPPTV